jgi:hypothetical protein
MVARMSNAQSGSLNVIEARAPALGGVPSGFQSLVPERRIDSADKAAPVPLTRLKLVAPPGAAAVAGAADSASMALNAIVLMPANIIACGLRLKSEFSRRC